MCHKVQSGQARSKSSPRFCREGRPGLLALSPFTLGRKRNGLTTPLSFLVFQSMKDPSLWRCPFHPPLQLLFVIRNTRQLQDFGLAKIKVWNYWTAEGVSTGPDSPWGCGGWTHLGAVQASECWSCKVHSQKPRCPSCWVQPAGHFMPRGRSYGEQSCNLRVGK